MVVRRKTGKNEKKTKKVPFFELLAVFFSSALRGFFMFSVANPAFLPGAKGENGKGALPLFVEP